MLGKHTPEFKRDMIKFYKSHKDASLEQAKKQAKRLGYDALSKAAHDKYRKQARGSASVAKTRKSAASETEVPDRCWMDLNTRKFYTNFDSGKPGTEVAIYKLIAKGNINLAYPQDKKGSQKRR